MPKQSDKKPRIRKTAPTVRDRMAAAQAQPEQKPKRVRGAAAKAASPFKKIKLPRFLAKILRPIGKVLKFLVPKYFVNSWREVRLVAWPSRSETWRLTGAVFVFAIVFGALVAAVDKGLDVVFKNIVLK